jgi:hypothetical protein
MTSRVPFETINDIFGPKTKADYKPLWIADVSLQLAKKRTEVRIPYIFTRYLFSSTIDSR